MIVEEDFCVGCPPEICRGGCQYRNKIKMRVCDNCEGNDDTLYIYNGKELCYGCAYSEIRNGYETNTDIDNKEIDIDNLIKELDTVSSDDVPDDDYDDYYEEYDYYEEED